MSQVKVQDKMTIGMIRQRILSGDIEIKGVYRLKHYRKGELIGEHESKNLVTTEGKRYLLSTGLASGTAKTAWYVGLVNNDNGAKNGGVPVAPSATQVYDTFFDTINTEYTNYTNANRVTWSGVLDGSLAKITNIASKAAFTFNTASGTLYGACLMSNNTKSNHASGDYLMSYSAFSAPIAVEIDDVVNVEIELSFT